MRDPLFWLYSEDFRIYNITVTRRLRSINAAILLCEMANKYRYFRDRGELTNDPRYGDGWFYYTYEDVEERTYLTRKNQDHCIAILEDAGLIEKRTFGVPAKRFFRLNINEINAYFFPEPEEDVKPAEKKRPLNDSPARMSKRDKLVCPSHTTVPARMSKRDKLDCPKGTNLYKEEEKHIRETEEYTPPTPVGVGEIAAGAAEREPVASLSKKTDRKAEEVKPPAPKPSPTPERKPPPRQKDTIPKPEADTAEVKQGYGPDGLVKLTQQQYADLLKHMTEAEREEWIIEVDLEIAKRGIAAFSRRYKSHYHTILSWRRYRERDAKTKGAGWSPGAGKVARHRLGSKMVTPGDIANADDPYSRDRL